MSKFVNDRELIIKRILQIINPDHTDDDIKNSYLSWWVNIRNTGGLGLTDFGYQCFQRAELDSFTFFINKSTPSLAVYAVTIDKKMLCPYHLRYIKRDRYITVYDTRIATLIQLHGNFDSYIDSLGNIND